MSTLKTYRNRLRKLLAEERRLMRALATMTVRYGQQNVATYSGGRYSRAAMRVTIVRQRILDTLHLIEEIQKETTDG